MKHVSLPAVLFSFLSFRFSLTQSSYVPCPILGPRYPLPSRVPESPLVEAALKYLTAALEKLTEEGGSSGYTATTPNTTSYSLALFDIDDVSNTTPPFFYEHHYASPSLKAQRASAVEVDSGSVYGIGGLSQALTVYSFLVSAGDDLWDDPITNYLPQLKTSGPFPQIEQVDWNNVRLIDLATQLAGIPRDAELGTIEGSIPVEIASLLPLTSDRQVTTPINEKELFFDKIWTRRPIYQPATTPIYSNAAFQLLAFALENITGSPFSTIVQEILFTPLNMSSSSVGTPHSEDHAIIPVNASISGWQTTSSNESALNAATSLFSTISDLSILGQSILRSTLLPQSTTNRWLKPYSFTSNPVNAVGMPFDIYFPTLHGDRTAPIIPIFTKYGVHGLYSPYFGLVPDYGVGFVILSADTEKAADLNAYVDLVSEHLIGALERTAAEQAAERYLGNYTGNSVGGGLTSLAIDVDGLGGLSLTHWTADNGTKDVHAAYAEMAGIPAATLDFRLYPTNLKDTVTTGSGNATRLAFRAVFQDVDAPVDAGTPTCVTWEDGVDKLVWNRIALDEFVFELDTEGGAVGVSVPALGMNLTRMSA